MSISAKIKKSIVHLLMGVYIIDILFPLMWMFISGFKNNGEIFGSPWKLPGTISFKNFIYVWNKYISGATANSLFFTITGTALAVIFSGMAAYAIIRFKIKGKYLLFMLILSGMMLAPQCSLIPIYKMLSMTKLYNTGLGLLLPYVAYRIPFSFFLMWSFMVTLRVEVEEAAIIDGCGTVGTFSRVVLPMCKPIIATTAIMGARYIWNDFSFALVFTDGKALRTVPMAIFSMRSTSQTDWGVLLAGLTLAAFPVVTLYIFLQKYFVSGLNAGAVKG